MFTGYLEFGGPKWWVALGVLGVNESCVLPLIKTRIRFINQTAFLCLEPRIVHLAGSSSGEVRIRVPTGTNLFLSILVGEPSPKKETVKGHYRGT